MKKLIIAASIFGAISLTSCGGGRNDPPQQRNNVTVSPMSNDVDIQADSKNTAFDVNALSEIVQKSTEPKVLEEKINDPATNINNLDLDKDGKIDYLTVTEGEDKTLEIKDASVDPAVVIAKLTITPNQEAKTASMQIDGTPQYCGPTYSYYRPSISFGELLFLSYLMSPHGYYRPMYGYGHYPSYYSSRRTVVRTTYHPTTSQYSRSPGGSSSSRPSGASSRSSVSTPTRSQRSFGTRDNSRPVGSGGFGNQSSRSSRPAASRPSSSPRRSFGGRRR